jgi:hypothetical protein
VAASKEVVMPAVPRPLTAGSLLSLCLLAGTAQAAPTPYVATVVHAEAEVRCKPSTKPELYPTNRLPQGTRVLVLEERGDGWLAIQPPPGSFSWVNVTQVERIVPTQTNWVVKNDGTPVLIGSEFVRERPTVEGVRLARGTQVRVVGQQEVDGNTAWLPIDPPPGEVRYVRAEAVAMAAPLPNATPAPTPATPVSRIVPAPTAKYGYDDQSRTSASPAATLNIPAATPTNAPSLPANATPWQKAEYLERQGRYDDAIRIYDQLGQDLKRDYPEWADFAAKRANFLRHGGRTPLNLPASRSSADVRASTFQPAAVSVPEPAVPQVRLAAPTDTTATVAPATTTSRTASWSSPQPSTGGLHPSGAGHLARAGRSVNGLPTYRLETNGGIWYVTPAQGVDLEAFVDHNVECFGTAQYNGELRANYMVVSRVQPM